jgi:hypothetical protein
MSFLSILGDLLPIMMPGPVTVTKGADLDPGTGQTEGMIRKSAIVGKSDKICASGINILHNDAAFKYTSRSFSEPSHVHMIGSQGPETGLC